MAWRWVEVLMCVVMVAMPAVTAAARLTLPSERPIVVRADSASNDPDTNVTRFSGHFELEGTDWPMQADEATVYGPLEEPERVIVVGRPARIWVKSRGIERDVAAQADEIEYTRGLDVLRLSGHARVVQGDRRMMEGDHFEYDLNTNRIKQGGPVRISVLPREKPAPAEEPSPPSAEDQPTH